MDKYDKLELGEFYKEMRLARKIKQKDVVKGKLSVSQLSKFETGQTMLSADKMLDVVEGINLTFAEFGFALRKYKPTNHQMLMSKLVTYSNSGNKEKLLQLLSQSDNSTLIYDQLNRLIIKNAIHIIDRSYPINSQEMQLLTTYLYDIENWTAYELHLFGNTMPFLSDTDLIFLGKELVERSKIYSALTDYRRLLKYTYLNLISEIIERKLTTHLSFFVKELQAILDIYDTFENILLNFLLLIFSYLIEKTIKRGEVEKYIDNVSKLQLHSLSELLNQRLSQYEELIL
ncbi:Rgg/GadR/MutR family transcriptional regulator [Streptococcus parauberis]|uniref:Rgg/GadR/MutR family transcriptional regulator n=1 Tax=Streptococcus parauberis TaxID=1348 RepID=UPI000E30112E|nr:Rgg/GadR/MutR family transcriptional regulator [Streptococcus parauberis]RFE01336.1 Helix-turn-helix domain protein [Streptococcus parauberis]